jgi:hypothetical protein
MEQNSPLETQRRSTTFDNSSVEPVEEPGEVEEITRQKEPIAGALDNSAIQIPVYNAPKRSLRGVTASIATAAFVLYWVSVMLAVPYFNWSYAQKNGFVSWLLLGEIVPTLKATVWPYYACDRFVHQKPSKKDFEQFSDSLEQYSGAMRVMRSIPVGQIATEQQAADFYRGVSKAREIGEMIDLAELNRTHAGFGDHFRDEYLAGLKAYESRDPKKADLGDELIRRWLVWLDSDGKNLYHEFNPD